MAEWNKIRLGDIVKINQNTYSQKEKWGYVNYLDTGNLTMNKVDSIQYIDLSKERLPSRAKRKVKYNSIVYSTVRPNQLHYGIIKEQPENFLVSTGFVVIDVDCDVANPDYIYYILTQREITEHLQAIGEQSVSAYPSIKPSDIEDLEIYLPSIGEQEKIVAILSAIDEKERNNIAINNNLLQQAVTIFQSFFSQESNINNAKISDVTLNVTDGVHNTVIDTPNGDYFLLSCKNIKGGCLSIGTSERRIDKNTFDKLRKRTKLSKGDVLISSVGTVGELLMLNNEPTNYEFQRSVAIVKPNPLIVSSAYLYLSLLTRKTELINVAHGAVQQCLFISDIAEFPMCIPNKDELVRFTDIVTPLFDLITSNENENICLCCLRDALSPKLLSSELDVSELDI